ncbi:insulinase family protein [Streptomyces sp. URMC 123]|uniref:insulinase family protein n=1 Tax=Streptomyces sp. URMC 123 TaxID=3423403 RepID=UPI003F1C0BFE
MIARLTLDNGLRVVLDPTPAGPIASVAVHYGVGFRSEPPGRAGFAHLFEHLMFEGSEHFPDRGYLAEVLAAGGQASGTTHQDYTDYFHTVPAHLLERALFAEADRMRAPRFTERGLAEQLAGVEREIQEAVHEAPLGGFPWPLLPDVLFNTFPNAHDGYGDTRALAGVTVADCEAFFREHYAPGNAVLTVSGGGDPERVARLVTRHFGDIAPRAVAARPALAEPEPDEDRVRFRTAGRATGGEGAVAVGHRLPDPTADPEGYLAHLVLARLLTDAGRRSPAARIADAACGFFGPFDALDPDVFVVTLRHPEGDPLDAVLAELDTQLRAAAAGLPGAVVATTVGRLAAELHRTGHGPLARARALGRLEVLYGRAELHDRLPDLVRAVGPGRVAAAARRLLAARRAVLVMTPASASARGGLTAVSAAVTDGTPAGGPEGGPGTGTPAEPTPSGAAPAQGAPAQGGPAISAPDISAPGISTAGEQPAAQAPSLRTAADAGDRTGADTGSGDRTGADTGARTVVGTGERPEAAARAAVRSEATAGAAGRPPAGAVRQGAPRPGPRTGLRFEGWAGGEAGPAAHRVVAVRDGRAPLCEVRLRLPLRPGTAPAEAFLFAEVLSARWAAHPALDGDRTVTVVGGRVHLDGRLVSPAPSGRAALLAELACAPLREDELRRAAPRAGAALRARRRTLDGLLDHLLPHLLAGGGPSVPPLADALPAEAVAHWAGRCPPWAGGGLFAVVGDLDPDAAARGALDALAAPRPGQETAGPVRTGQGAGAGSPGPASRPAAREGLTRLRLPGPPRLVWTAHEPALAARPAVEDLAVRYLAAGVLGSGHPHARLTVLTTPEAPLGFPVFAGRDSRYGAPRIFVTADLPRAGAVAAAALVRREIRRLGEVPPTDAEVRAAQRYCGGQLYSAFETQGELADMVAAWELLGLDSGRAAAFADAVADLSPTAVARTCAEVFTVPPFTGVLVGETADPHGAPAPATSEVTP